MIGSLDAKFKDPVFRKDQPQIVAINLDQTIRRPVRLAYDEALGPVSGYLAGTVLARKTSDGLFYPYDDGGSGGLETATCVLMHNVVPASGDTDMGIGIFKGTLFEDKLVGLDANAKTDLGARTIVDATGVSLLTF